MFLDHLPQLEAVWDTALLLGLGVAALTDLLRTFLWDTKWRARKPLSCDTCMSWWLALLAMCFVHAIWPARPIWAASIAGISIMSLGALRYVRSGDSPPQLPQ